MSHGSSSQLPLPFPLFFLLLWLFVSTLLNWMSGYRALRKRYPPVDEPKQQVFRAVSGVMRGIPYRNSLTVGLGPTGLHLGPQLLFRLTFGWGVPCIPWADLRCTHASSRGERAWSPGYDFEIPSMKLRFSLHGKAGAALARQLGMEGD